MSEKAYVDIIFDDDGIGYMQMRADRRYNLSDLVALYWILQFHEDKHDQERINTGQRPNTGFESDAADGAAQPR